MCLAIGGLDSYDFHALEVIQCMAERRRGGETGVVAMQGLRGDAVWKAIDAGSWAAGGWDPQLFAACLSRTQTLAQPETFSDRYPDPGTNARVGERPRRLSLRICRRAEGDDAVDERPGRRFHVRRRLKGQADPLSTLFYLPPNPNVTYSAELMSKAEETFLTGKTPYPVERTLLTSGLVAAGMLSLGTGQKRIETPHLAVRYQAPRESTFAHS